MNVIQKNVVHAGTLNSIEQGDTDIKHSVAGRQRCLMGSWVEAPSSWKTPRMLC